MTKTIDPDWPLFIIYSDDDNDERYNLIHEKGDLKDKAGREYESLGEFLENDDFYQGLCMITVIRRKGDGKLFGFSWWDDISKHGESYVEPNGYDYGLSTDYEDDERGGEVTVSYYVFEPVVESSLPIYEKVN